MTITEKSYSVPASAPATEPWSDRLRRMPDAVWFVISGTVAIAAFQAMIWLDILPSKYFPSVAEIGATLVELAGTTRLWAALGDTLISAGIGLLIAIVLATVVGVVAGMYELVYRSIRVVVEFLRPIPSVALVPLVVLAYGTGRASALFLVAFACFWPLLVHTIYGIRDIDPVVRDTARVFRISWYRSFFRVTVPSAAPYILTGIRISVSIAMILAITAEIVIGMPGLGRQITLAQQNGALAEMYAFIMVTGIVGYGINRTIMYLEKRTLSWHESQRPRSGGAA